VVGIVFFGAKIVIILGMFNFVFGFGGRILAGSREKSCLQLSIITWKFLQTTRIIYTQAGNSFID
jgi:hypothetical protein